MPGVDQRPTECGVALQRFVDGFAVFLKFAQMPSLRLLELLTQITFVHFQRLVDQSRH